MAGSLVTPARRLGSHPRIAAPHPELGARCLFVNHVTAAGSCRRVAWLVRGRAQQQRRREAPAAALEIDHDLAANYGRVIVAAAAAGIEDIL